MDLKLENKHALVSGSAKGIGRAIAMMLAAEGASVIITGRTGESVAMAQAEIRRHFPDARLDGYAGDLAAAETIKELVARFPAVDILVNNLGIYEPKPFVEILDEDWLRFFEINVMSGVRLARAYLPRMKECNWGRVVFISSESGIQIPTEMIHYGMTKTAQLAISRGLAETCAGTGVTVNAVLPGPTLSEGVETFITTLSAGKPFAEFEREFFRDVRPTSLLQRFAAPEEVANLVAYLCSPLSSATNGAALRVDGGVVKSCF
ncbi:SDR family NAD(P)-dependent oxidoreductase [Geobacter argillaceus]|uniref:NAD(P)-dependent dehydrogenase (Short-subunit alcohol dehydrogenase family) n=1 Tax=Geobacter argillaceus TaxID=345631 RepID=A0A562VF87_9BACT|nr:SDR family oxidoreductase [Geobacter argillaceus]TWJ16560.1 NAD(P)-dependent dehydrogenase (short-subunit alcohol dehydrogenase family) [Geobacter argillaceus]